MRHPFKVQLKTGSSRAMGNTTGTSWCSLPKSSGEQGKAWLPQLDRGGVYSQTMVNPCSLPALKKQGPNKMLNKK